MMGCRVCRSGDIRTIYQSPAPSITSLTTTLPTPTSVFACPACGHAQSNDLPEASAFYDTAYRISLDTEDHDQIITDRHGQPVFRTELQTQLVLALLDPQPGQKILDFGAAKAATLKRIVAKRKDVEAFVFDVSDDYRPAWHGWLDETHCATYTVPPHWIGTFDAITAHFVIEHVADPVETLSFLRSLLKQGGRLFVTVPSVLANPGDLLVVDHLSHFSPASLERALNLAGFGTVDVEDDGPLPAALLAIASNTPSTSGVVQAQNFSAIEAVAANWSAARSRLRREREAHLGRKAAIFGAGFYGTWIASVLMPLDDVLCFVDNNPHLQSQTRFGRPVILPRDMPDDIEVIYVGLNPSHSRQVIERCRPHLRADLQWVWL
ncbi:hypothetical protein BHK69_07815 [Bosea vaviloviae]|uniref:Methyltransferase type 12 n=1 Tax=Bosea vaviloviae TaxID=1526658 RepID=A0A1D7TZ34_9HYPH|nr:hypothetical protein BHK69_07815 [Bosea vaviloviae]